MKENELKSSDLMIGDYLFGQPDNRIVRVIELKDDDIVCNQRCYDLEPIPITPDILKNNGFDGKDETYLCFTDSKEDISIKCLYPYMSRVSTDLVRVNIIHEYDSVSLLLSSVHELQHAMRMCGIKKEIKL